MMLPHITGKTILVVEDDPLLALDLVDRLELEGVIVAGPVATVAEAMSILDLAAVDAALLDINLRAETSYPIADRLLAGNVPFLFVTSLAGNVVPNGYRKYVIDKMASIEIIQNGLFAT